MSGSRRGAMDTGILGADACRRSVTQSLIRPGSNVLELIPDHSL